MARRIFALSLFFLAAACTHALPPLAAGCELKAYPLPVDPHWNSASDSVSDSADTSGREDCAGTGARTPLQAAICRVAAASRGGGDEAARPRALLLSGGSQHGAFGAGFFQVEPVPSYNIVSGVSTGALQSTFLFLANRQVRNDRVYPAYVTDRRPPAQHTNVGDLELAYSIAREKDLMTVRSGGIPAAVVHGALARFDGLRGVIKDLISPGTLEDIADEGKTRLLVVGVTNVDDGAGYALDLTELASRMPRNPTPEQAAPFQNCFAEALIASSSVPLAVPPVMLRIRTDEARPAEPHLFIDGGARYSVIFEQLRRQAPGDHWDVDALVNGGFFIPAWTKAGQPWSLPSVGMRSLDVLENQVSRFSVYDVFRRDNPGRTRLAYIGPGAPAFRFTIDGVEQTCSDWSRADERDYKVTEFHPRYMRCLIAYGRSRVGANRWDRVEPPGS
ncbi:MAG: patatin-like phospholipase family protein [Alphaproteobacteria bacterium]|nr:patatin-like phospholipase family protein [Alphaproteobacteria bacterium]